MQAFLFGDVSRAQKKGFKKDLLAGVVNNAVVRSLMTGSETESVDESGRRAEGRESKFKTLVCVHQG